MSMTIMFGLFFLLGFFRLREEHLTNLGKQLLEAEVETTLQSVVTNDALVK
jgi:hypothetical protein